jgi:hypothetical protein
MKKLSIRVLNSNEIVIQTLICHHLDAVNSHTLLIQTNEVNGRKCFVDQFCIMEKIDHWNIMDGLITIYYNNGLKMEISRIND